LDTSSNPLNTARRRLSRCRNSNSSLAFGGEILPGATGATEEYDGTSWATSPGGSLNTARII
jgi:hypothetical protein